ncbi:hypothetical protein Tco_0878751 [Tanacetum coccineum]|uniref:Uncharacterized protein n=1 Tax=Tanacetum coccineum TaxID=301880 RepID=A0ABQ5BZ33_9ASTR
MEEETEGLVFGREQQQEQHGSRTECDWFRAYGVGRVLRLVYMTQKCCPINVALSVDSFGENGQPPPSKTQLESTALAGAGAG